MLMMVVFCVLAGVIELYFVLKSKSMIVAAIMHGTINAVSGMTIYFTLGGNDFLNGMAGLSGFITMAVTIVCIWVYDKFVSKDNILSMTLGDSIGRETARHETRDDGYVSSPEVTSPASKTERD